MFEFSSKEWALILIGLIGGIPVAIIANWLQRKFSGLFESSKLRLVARRRSKDFKDLELLTEFKNRKRDVYLWATKTVLFVILGIGVSCLSMLLASFVFNMGVAKYGIVERFENIPSKDALLANIVVLVGMAISLISLTSAAFAFLRFVRLTMRYDRFEKLKRKLTEAPTPK